MLHDLMSKKKYAFVGTGGRVNMFLTPALGRFAEYCEVVGLCDLSQVRREHWATRMKTDHGVAIPTYAIEEFDRMVEEGEADSVIVTTMDSAHHTYINRALEMGRNAITEKPMTTDAEKCRSILEAVSRHRGEVRVCFNYRWHAYNSRVKELIQSGVIGTVRSVNMEYLLDTRHGADYYRRWHSHMASSGGLLVHKSTHHFDLVNWWIDSVPQQVAAYGKLSFYGEKNARARGDEAFTGYPHYTDEPRARDDPFALDLKENVNLKHLYYDAQEETGYHRDQNVFRDGIDIYDNMAVLVNYRNGVLLTYSLNSYSPREGMRVTFNGDRGRIEYHEFGGSHLIKGQSEEELDEEQRANPGHHEITVFPHFKPRYHVAVIRSQGGHGGADPLLQEQIFSPHPPEEKLDRNAGHEQGAASILIGIAANEAIAANRMINVDDLAELKPGATRLSELV